MDKDVFISTTCSYSIISLCDSILHYLLYSKYFLKYTIIYLLLYFCCIIIFNDILDKIYLDILFVALDAHVLLKNSNFCKEIHFNKQNIISYFSMPSEASLRLYVDSESLSLCLWKSGEYSASPM